MRKLIALFAAAAFTAGCSLITPQATVIKYDPGVGFSLNLANGVELRGIFVSSEGTSSGGNLVVTVFSDKARQIQVRGAGFDTAFDVDEGMNVFGPDKKIDLSAIEVSPGALISLTFTADGQSKSIQVPVLNEDLPELKGLAPGSTATPGVERRPASPDAGSSDGDTGKGDASHGSDKSSGH